MDTNPLINQNYLYIVKCEDAYKIGVSSLPEQRIALIKTDNYKPVEKIAIIRMDNAYEAEKLIHASFKSAGRHLKGEWFYIHPEELEYYLGVISDVDEVITNNRLLSLP